MIGHRRPYPFNNEAAQLLTLEVFDLEYRLVKLADQIEKLSWMLEFMADRYEEDGYLVIPCKIEHCEEAWKAHRSTP